MNSVSKSQKKVATTQVQVSVGISRNEASDAPTQKTNHFRFSRAITDPSSSSRLQLIGFFFFLSSGKETGGGLGGGQGPSRGK